MPKWLDRLLGRSTQPPPPSIDLLGAPITDAAAWFSALGRRAQHDPAWLREHLPQLRGQLERWYADNPIEVVWGRSYDLRIRDPLPITTDDVVWGDDVIEVVPWATLLRSLVIVTDGPNVLHHGCGVAEVLELLRDPSAPERIESLSLPHLVVEAASEVDGLIEALCTSERLRELRHLRLPSASFIEPRHIERLARAPWARSLQTLDVTEVMADWSVDCAGELHAALRALGRFESLTHLFLYSAIGTSDDLAVLLEAKLPALTHLNLGVAPGDPAVLDRLAETRSLPRLQELCLAGGPARECPGWERLREVPFAVYLHGQRVPDEPQGSREHA